MNLVNLIHDLTSAINTFNLNFDCFAYGQLESKQWLIDELERINFNLGIVFNLCGWYGLLPAMMFQSRLDIQNIRSFDIDPNCWIIADQMNKSQIKNSWRFKAATEDINDINFNKHTWEGWSNLSRKNISVTESPNVIINTSCEHTKDDWFKKIPKGLMVVLQSNDYLQGDGHINCCGDLRDFDASYTLTDTFYLGQKELEKYTRFMKIGIK
jgi:hypothetical protein